MKHDFFSHSTLWSFCIAALSMQSKLGVDTSNMKIVLERLATKCCLYKISFRRKFYLELVHFLAFSWLEVFSTVISVQNDPLILQEIHHLLHNCHNLEH